MAGYFFDTSALVKRYVLEAGTTWVRGLTAAENAPVYLARLTSVELTAAIARRRRGSRLPAAEATAILGQFQRHLAGQYVVADMTNDLLASAARLADRCALRGYDAVQLAAARTIDARSRAAGLGAVTLISADGELNAAAQAEGLTVDDPNIH